MKRLPLVILFSLALSWSAGAQVSNRFSLGVGTGLDGTSFELGTRLGDHVQVRLGYGTAFGLGYTLKGEEGIRVPQHPAMEDSPEINVPMKLSFARNDARLLFNFYPGSRATFHITLGAYLGSGSFFKGEVKNLPDDYNNTGLEMGDYTVKAINNTLRVELRAFGLGSPGFAILPYAGLGFGRPVRADKRVTFSFDLGAAYQGEPSLWARSVKADGTRAYVNVSDNDLIDISEVVEEYGQYLNFWPVINFHLYFRLF
ncbi:MAG: hypothetical protein IKO29_05355 [Bacteroidales bacterium]|nr:hypothetical protein [Bacteroidales bacterium]